MDLQDFYNGIKTLGDWFGKRLTGPQQDIIYKAIKFIPDRAWKDLIEKYTKKYKPIPSNFPTSEDIVNQWYIWRNENPELVLKEFKTTPCKDCHSRGLLWFKATNEELARDYEHSVRCAACENWKQHFNHFTKVPLKFKRDLQQDPLVIEIWPYERGIG